jgi:hypothetical protein
MDVNGAGRPKPAGAGGVPGTGKANPTVADSFDVITTADDAAWANVLADVGVHDFHHLRGYHRLAEYQAEGTALLFAYRSGPHVVAIPLLLRPVEPGDPAGPWDATSVYGYGGPIASPAPVPEAVVVQFQHNLRLELARRRVVTVFSRLHPLLEQRRLVTGLGEIADRGPTVSIDLTLPPEEQWAGYSKGTRRLIRRAAEAGVVGVHDEELRYLGEWVAIYRGTMERVGASSSYFFDAAYFERMVAELGPVVHLFVALVDGRVAAAGLFTLCSGIVQAHLGGSRPEYSAVSPARVVDDTARRWAHASGAHVFHLGGGVGGREDSLFRYKAGFSDRRHHFSTWRWVVDRATYERLVREHARRAPIGEQPTDDYFPAYR